MLSILPSFLPALSRSAEHEGVIMENSLLRDGVSLRPDGTGTEEEFPPTRAVSEKSRQDTGRKGKGREMVTCNFVLSTLLDTSPFQKHYRSKSHFSFLCWLRYIQAKGPVPPTRSR